MCNSLPRSWTTPSKHREKSATSILPIVAICEVLFHYSHQGQNLSQIPNMPEKQQLILPCFKKPEEMKLRKKH
jgi:hypothetical protein